MTVLKVWGPVLLKKVLGKACWHKKYQYSLYLQTDYNRLAPKEKQNYNVTLFNFKRATTHIMRSASLFHASFSIEHFYYQAANGLQ